MNTQQEDLNDGLNEENTEENNDTLIPDDGGDPSDTGTIPSDLDEDDDDLDDLDLEDDDELDEEAETQG